jgi:hypothetical protein
MSVLPPKAVNLIDVKTGHAAVAPQPACRRLPQLDAAAQPADCELRAGPCVALLGEVFEVLANTRLLGVQALGIARMGTLRATVDIRDFQLLATQNRLGRFPKQ